MKFRFCDLLLLSFCILLSAFRISVSAQTLQLRDGTTVPALALRREGDTLVAKIKTNGENTGEIGYPLASILRVDFPDPAVLKTASEMLDKGQAEEAARQLAPAAAYYLPFHDVPGNHWKALAILHLDALTAARRDREADAAAAELARLVGADPEVVRVLKLRLAQALLRQGDADKALALLNPLALAETSLPTALAPVWIGQGGAWLSRREYKAALLAYLHVPVYAPESKRFMPAALLGAVRAYIGLDDRARAEDTLDQLLSAYPSAPETAEARQQIEHLTSSPSESTPKN